MAINVYVGAGNLTKDAELRALPSGTPLIEFGIAVNERKKNQQSGEWEDDPVFLDCVMYGQRAERLAQYLAKGTRVTVHGRLRWDSWTDRETGKKRSKIDVVVSDLLFMSRNDASGAPQGPNYGPMPAPPQNVVQATPQVQQAVNDTFSSATPFNSPYPGGNFRQQDGQIPEVWSEDIPFD